MTHECRTLRAALHLLEEWCQTWEGFDPPGEKETKNLIGEAHDALSELERILLHASANGYILPEPRRE